MTTPINTPIKASSRPNYPVANGTLPQLINTLVTLESLPTSDAHDRTQFICKKCINSLRCAMMQFSELQWKNRQQ